MANRSSFAVVSVDGFNPEKVKDYSKGIELTLGTSILKGVIFDRDYKSEGEIKEIEKQLGKILNITHVHKRKEIENYVIEPTVIRKAIEDRLAEQNARTEQNVEFTDDVGALLDSLTNPLKHEVGAQHLSKRLEYEKRKSPGTDNATITTALMEEFDALWTNLDSRLALCPGKRTIALLNQHLQATYGITVSPNYIAQRFSSGQIPDEIRGLIESLDAFQQQELP